MSESGKHYKPTNQAVRKNDIVTIDLSPVMNSYWGDYARTYIIRNGQALTEYELTQHKSDSEFADGITTEQLLHHKFMKYVSPDKTFEDVYLYINEIIKQHNYKNLDFAGNLGHTIEFHMEDRQYFEAGNQTTLGEVRLFTFEPHIQRSYGRYGFKKEDIYYFQNDEVVML
ncbi:aminopeptidase P family protein [Paenibacillus dendritiformis]|uniref:M24 family metallopeptidase n=1 Tax=Paenibacillus dendritiformis TaxID=130049 RepID=UPI001059A96D|nr:M24 family metallopeptidase [Paenibacillus dendritiformis]TDL58233.1 aminopeptidase P family protein [Paenibacillus dendritiformis]